MKRTKAKVAPVSEGPSYDPMLIGYVRVSTREQNEEMQTFALAQAGVMTLVVWRLDRVSRSMIDMLTLLRQMEADQISLRSLTEYLDTRGAIGKLMIHILGAFAQFESDSGIERTTAGIRRAQANGKKFGQPTKIIRKHWYGEKLESARAGIKSK